MAFWAIFLVSGYYFTYFCGPGCPNKISMLFAYPCMLAASCCSLRLSHGTDQGHILHARLQTCRSSGSFQKQAGPNTDLNPKPCNTNPQNPKPQQWTPNFGKPPTCHMPQHLSQLSSFVSPAPGHKGKPVSCTMKLKALEL